MKYFMFVTTHGTETADGTDAPSIESWLAECERRGVRLDGDRLADPKEGRTVRRRNGELLVTDGPFVETNELIAGYDVLECGSIEEAIEIASLHPMAYEGTIEVRPFWAGDDQER